MLSEFHLINFFLQFQIFSFEPSKTKIIDTSVRLSFNCEMGKYSKLLYFVFGEQLTSLKSFRITEAFQWRDWEFIKPSSVWNVSVWKIFIWLLRFSLGSQTLSWIPSHKIYFLTCVIHLLDGLEWCVLSNSINHSKYDDNDL